MVDVRKTQMIQRGREKTVYRFQVVPDLPEELKFLETLAYNLWYVWDREALDVFRRIDRELWDETGHNAVAFLGRISQDKFKELAADESFMANLVRVKENLDKYLNGKAWYQKNQAGLEGLRIAYFSAEFGINESVRIYSGGLGMLAGDHLK
ncbi:MAG: DUF3417 domain-containing protein, partial [Planctomycetes bacterium]|nr:DUF3417 domain-containing protein [Planctomycetota bacterium]